jgi:hypothetical protein
MKKAESFVHSLATVFITFSVVMGLGYFFYGLLVCGSNIGSEFANIPHADNMGPITPFIFAHLLFFVVSGVVFEIITFAASIGLLSHQDWARKTFLVLFAFLGLKHFVFLASCLFQVFSPRVELFYKLWFHSLILSWIVFAISFLFQLASVGLYVWLCQRFTQKDIRSVFK